MVFVDVCNSVSYLSHLGWVKASDLITCKTFESFYKESFIPSAMGCFMCCLIKIEWGPSQGQTHIDRTHSTKHKDKYGFIRFKQAQIKLNTDTEGLEDTENNEAKNPNKDLLLGKWFQAIIYLFIFLMYFLMCF